MHFSLPTLHSTSPFAWQLAMNAALASALAYKDAPEIEATAARWGFARARFFSVRNTQGFVACDDRCVLVSFRGSSQLGNWLSNLNTVRSSVAYGSVHSGFLNAFNDARPTLEGLLAEAGASGKTFWATGHSLGGALATIMAGELHGGFDLAGIYTFGQPRSVNREARRFFESSYPSSIFYLVNDDDVVPKVPPLLSHVGQLVWFDKRGDLKEAPSGVRNADFEPEAFDEEEFESFKEEVAPFERRIDRAHQEVAESPLVELLSGDEAAVRGALPTRGVLPSVRDHFMDNYLAKVLAKLQSES